MCINEACCERFWASLCKYFCTCVFAIIGIIAILAGVGILQDDTIDKRYGYGAIGGGGLVLLLGGCIKFCCADAVVSKDGHVYQTF